MGKIRTSKEDREKQYIKEELMRYHLYEEKIEELKDEIRQFKIEYQEILNDPPIGGSIIKLPDGTSGDENIVMRLERRLNDMETNLQYYTNRLHILNQWLRVLTQEQRNVIKVYVCLYQCQDRSHAAIELKCSEDNVKKRTNDGVRRIMKIFKEFL